MSSTEISKNFKQLNPGPLSEWYGPYPDLLSACYAIPNVEGLYEGVMVNFRKDKVVGITTPEGTVDYWWPKLFTNAGLVRKEVSKLEFDTYVASQNERNIILSEADTYLQQQVTTHGNRITAVEDLAAIATTPAEVNTAIQAAVGALMNGAPGALDTLKELADAMGNNPNFAATITNALAVLSGADTYLQQQVTNNKTQVAVDIEAAISALMDGAPGALNTLKGLADAIGNDPHFAVTVASSFAAVVARLNTQDERNIILSEADTYLQQQVSTNQTRIEDVNFKYNQIYIEHAAKIFAVEQIAAEATTTALMNTAIQAAVAALINGAPGAFDTLKELTEAMGNDPNFAATVTNALATLGIRMDNQDARNIILSGADTYLQQQVDTLKAKAVVATEDIDHIEDQLPGFVTKNESVFAGRFPTIAAANLAIPNVIVGGRNARDGKQVLIGSANNYIAYWWNAGFGDENLVEYINGKVLYPMVYIDDEGDLIASSFAENNINFSLDESGDLILTI